MSEAPLRLLLVEDDEDDYVLVRDLLMEASRDRYVLDWTPSYEEALHTIWERRHDGILVDYRLGPDSGLGLVREITAEQIAPVIVLTGQDSPEVDHQVMEAGAADYLVKGELTPALLERAIRYAIRQHGLLERIRTLSLTDSLTGVQNRRGFRALSEPQLKLATRRRKPALVFFIDLDGVKEINDLLGHQHGDEALREAARLLKSVLRESDVVARIGGDEFAALAIDAGAEEADIVLRRLDEQLRKLNSVPDREFRLGLSVGYTEFDPRSPASLDTLVQRADAAMYDEKRRKGKDASNVVPGVPRSP